MATFMARVRDAFGVFRRLPPTVTEGEVAFSDPRRLFPGGYYAPYNPSLLVRGRGLAIFDQMRKDDQIKAALAFKKHTVIATGWTVTSPEGQPDDWEPARFVESVLSNLDPNEIGSSTLEGDLYEILGAIDYGYSVTEKIWAPIEVGEFKGKIGLKALKTRAPHSFRFGQDEYGNIEPDGIIQLMNNKVTGGRLPRSKFVLYSYQSQFSNPYGCSDLEAAYPAWWTKDNAQKWLAILLERLGIPPVFGLYDPNRYTPQQIDDLKAVITNLQAATFGIIPKPGGTSGQGNETLSFWAPEIAGQATRVFIPSLEYLNKAIARAILMPGLLGLTSDTSQGSFARAKVHFDVFLLVVEALRKDISQVVMAQQIIRPLVDLNYPGLTEYPIWQFLPITDELQFQLISLWKDLVAGQIVTAQVEDETHIRRVTGFPELNDPASSVAAQPPPAATPAATPAPPTGRPDPGQGQPADVVPAGAVHVEVHPPHITIEAPAAAAAPSVTIGEGAVQVNVPAAAAPAVTVNAPVTIEAAPAPHVTIAEGAVQVEAPVTVHAPVTVEPARVEIAEGAIQVATTVTPPVVTIAEGAIQVEAPVTVEAPVVTIAEGAVQVDSPVTVSTPPAVIPEPLEAFIEEKTLTRDPKTGRATGTRTRRIPTKEA